MEAVSLYLDFDKRKKYNKRIKANHKNVSLKIFAKENNRE
jgi:hypothetical protein